MIFNFKILKETYNKKKNIYTIIRQKEKFYVNIENKNKMMFMSIL